MFKSPIFLKTCLKTGWYTLKERKCVGTFIPIFLPPQEKYKWAQSQTVTHLTSLFTCTAHALSLSLSFYVFCLFVFAIGNLRAISPALYVCLSWVYYNFYFCLVNPIHASFWCILKSLFLEWESASLLQQCSWVEETFRSSPGQLRSLNFLRCPKWWEWRPIGIQARSHSCYILAKK